MTIVDFLTGIWDAMADGFFRVRHLVDGTIYNEFTGYTLADIAAKRKIVEYHGNEMLTCCQEDGLLFPCRTLRALALPFAEHADYDEAWRV